MHTIASCLLVLLFWTSAIQAAQGPVLKSPHGTNEVRLTVDQGTVRYQVLHNNQELIRPSMMGFTFHGEANLGSQMEVSSVQYHKVDYWWEQVWGEERWIRDHHNEMLVELKETISPHRVLRIRFRAFEDGVGFRYEFPGQGKRQTVTIQEELTEFSFVEGFRAWWIPAFTNETYELLYRNSSLDEMPAALTPVTLNKGNLSVSLHEANLTDFASMSISGKNRDKLRVKLAPWKDGSAVKGETPMVSPWRTIQIADKPGDLITSYLILNLNEPNKMKDTSWIHPRKYVGIWWGMHIGKYSWASGAQHGATTERAKRYIDFAQKNGIPGFLVEGWNHGWDGDWVSQGHLFNFTKPYPDFDLWEVARYGKERGVHLVGHHETGGAVSNYESQAEAAFSLYQSVGVDMVKTGYVGTRVEGGEWHYGQFMVRHHQKISDLAAKYKIMLNIHEPVKDTGLRRTFPHLMSREGARGMEWNAWAKDGGNPPSHDTILPFTRGLAGPFDITPGIMDLSKGVYPKGTTVAKQLALYVVIFSPVHMAADLPENYENHPGMQFIRDVPTDWHTTRVLDGSIGDHLTIARKDRNSSDWYVGAVTDEHPRELEISLSFLDSKASYIAEIYRDGSEAEYKNNPMQMVVEKKTVQSSSVLKLRMAPGGGVAIRLTKLRK